MKWWEVGEGEGGLHILRLQRRGSYRQLSAGIVSPVRTGNKRDIEVDADVSFVDNCNYNVAFVNN